MTAQHNQPEDQLATTPVDEQPDPIGPITLPTRPRVGARALALVGTAGMLAIGGIGFAETCGPFTTISVY
jgi:hypothetical protein